MPSNHISNEPYHEWLAEQHKKNKMKTFKTYLSGKHSSEFIFEWNNGTEETSIPVSMHGAIKLAETFKEFGYVEKRGESLNHMFGDVPKALDKLTVIKEEETK